MRMFDFMCPECQHSEEKLFGTLEPLKLTCAACGAAMERVWMKPPSMGTIGKEGTDANITAMKKSFRERYVKKEQVDVLHRHGKLYGDSIRSAASQRIQKGKKPT